MNAPVAAFRFPAVREEVADLIAESRDLLIRAGRVDLAENLIGPTGRRPPPDRPVVAVIGETSRGKSALVNALIGRPDLSPVDPQVTTCVPILFTYDDPEWARVWIHPGPDVAEVPPPLDITIDAIADYAHETRNPGNAKLVQRVDVGLASATLDALGLVIADTPGVGGLISGHADLALAQLTSSDAVLLVLDAATEMSPSEVAFLKEAAARVPTVIIAITKTDLQYDIGRVVDVNRERIRSEVPELSDPLLIPVSSRLVELAEELPEPARDETRAASGIVDLITALDERVRARQERIDLAAVVQGCLQRLAHLDAHLAAAAASVDEVVLRNQLEYNENRLTRLQRTQADWHGGLTMRLAQLEDDVVGHPGVAGDTLAADLDTLVAHYRTQAKDADSQDEFDRLVRALQAAAFRTCSKSSLALENAVAEAFASVIEAGVEMPPGTVIQPPGVAVPSATNKPDRLEDKTFIDIMTAIAPAVAVHGVLMVATGATAAAQQYWALILIPPLAGLAVRQYNAKARRKNFLQWLDGYGATVVGHARRSCEAAVAAAESAEVRGRIDALIDAEVVAAGDAVAGQTAALQTDPGVRAREADRVKATVAEMAGLGARAHRLLTTLTTGSS